SIEVVIDLHRDGIAPGTHLVTELNGKKTAKIMFFNGVSYSRALGPITYLKNPNLKENLSFSMQMQLAADTFYPGLSRGVYIKGYRYNMHLKGRNLLVEVGAQTNTYAEAKNAMEPLADLLHKILQSVN
ncbi:MAG: stage II sporulation protein P, partial [Lachnospiraceae bacterium]|nr:stage II sporulation protein P [Lachnospiraceae bacterium]